VPEMETCDAILQAWYPGQEGGTAIAEVLYGEVNPSGKLPITFYESVAQLPDFENYDMTGHTYRFFTGKPLFPFGYGLSYTTFEYSDPKIEGKEVKVEIKNTGDRDGVATVQLYINKPSDTEGPIKTLRSFKRVSVPAGSTFKVSFTLDDDIFTWWDGKDMAPVHGEYNIMCGLSSADLKATKYNF